MALDHRKALVLQQLLQLARVLLYPGRGIEVAADGASELRTREQQLALALALGGRAPDLADSSEADADQDHYNQQTDVSEPA